MTSAEDPLPRDGVVEGPGFDERHVYGAAGAPITVLEFGDFECPYCAAAAPVLRTFVDQSDGVVRLVWRHFPLFRVHPHALIAALAAEAAGEQGAFWAMHDRLFADPARLSDVDLAARGRELGIDATKLTGDAAQVHAEAVQCDYEAGARAGVHGTPTLFIDEQPYAGAIRLEALREQVGLSSRGRRAPWRRR